jgi:hypothetical protein
MVSEQGNRTVKGAFFGCVFENYLTICTYLCNKIHMLHHITPHLNRNVTQRGLVPVNVRAAGPAPELRS